MGSQMLAMRGWVGDLVFFFDKNGHAIGLQLWREWGYMGIWLEPGQEVWIAR